MDSSTTQIIYTALNLANESERDIDPTPHYESNLPGSQHFLRRCRETDGDTDLQPLSLVCDSGQVSSRRNGVLSVEVSSNHHPRNVSKEYYRDLDYSNCTDRVLNYAHYNVNYDDIKNFC
uniref:Uncharacterized protein n=1 Tax=Ceratitis capitata TaxID=7213 RepID=W8C3Q8_CERCA